MPKHSIEDLNLLYNDADSCDSQLFSEMRSNVLLTAGEHYSRRGSRFWQRLRDSKALNNDQKLRLTKNHIQVIVKKYVNNITNFAPGVTVLPHNDNDLQEQKIAELNQSVWSDLKARHKLSRKVREFADDFVQMGEVICKVYFDPTKGRLLGYKPKLDPAGQPIADETGQPQMDEGSPVMSGDICFERIFGFNLLRAKEAKEMDESGWFCYRKMVPAVDLKKMLPEDDPRAKYIEDSSRDTYTVFDGSTGSYENTKGQCMVREYYFRPCADYPKGYYYITTQAGILFEDELPYGIYPIVYQKFDEIKTSPRGRSIIKQLRPYQAEINRSASKMAEHQISLGDDKLLIQTGTKIAHGGQLPGVRAIQYSGAPPQFLSGRSGEQYLAYMQSQISEMYQIAQVEEDMQPKGGQLDPYSMLYQSLRQKKSYSIYAEKFEDFLVALCEVSLLTAKQYYNEAHLIPAISKKEYVNIPEFKNSDPLMYHIKLEPQVEDIESKMGKQLTLNHILQYVGTTLGKDDIGRIMRSMPYMDNEEAFGDLTIDYDSAKNAILALDRGELPQVYPYENHKYMIKRLTNRMQQADFRILPPQVQQNYQVYMNQQQQIEIAELQKIKEAESQFIPAGGFMVGCDFYVNDPNSPGKTRRARVPYQSLEWLINMLEQQGLSLDKLENLQQGVLADMASKMPQQQEAAPSLATRLAAHMRQPQPMSPMSGGMGAQRAGQAPVQGVY